MVLLTSILLFFALILLSVVAIFLFFITLFGIVGSLIAVVGVLVWWLKPAARQVWLKWLIVAAAPFGLPAYLFGRWSMYVPAAVLEGQGPLGALRRSGQLVDRNWFRVVSILTVASLIVAVLQWAPATLVEVPLTIGAASRGQFGLPPTESAIVSAIAVALQILFASIGTIVYTLVFIDLRNRREATDLVERVSYLEAAPAPVNG